MRLLDERESIRKYLRDWYNLRYKRLVPIFDRRIQGDPEEESFIISLADSSSQKIAVRREH